MHSSRPSSFFRNELFDLGLYLFLFDIVSSHPLFRFSETKPLVDVAAVFDNSIDNAKLVIAANFVSAE
jgi:hypothetical protein